jgi:hypothetical protein
MNHPTNKAPFEGLDITVALVLVDRVMELYQHCPTGNNQKTFGDWVLTTFYKDLYSDDVTIDRDFRGAQRTSDAETYLVGLLWKGRLDPNPLQEAVKQATKK